MWSLINTEVDWKGGGVKLYWLGHVPARGHIAQWLESNVVQMLLYDRQSWQ